MGGARGIESKGKEYKRERETDKREKVQEKI